ncbi:hypothetical protein ACWOBE_03680 [Hutsoniella sourekii]
MSYVKYTSLFCLLGSLFSQPVQAISPVTPYVLAREIQVEESNAQACAIYLRGEEAVPTIVDQSNQQSQEQIRSALEEKQALFEALNQEIVALESQGEHSLANVAEQVEHVIEEVYMHYFDTDPDFPSYSQEAQYQLVSQHESVQEWQAYHEELRQELESLLAQRNEVEAEYNELNYQWSQIQEQQQANSQHQAALNQCALYPYTSDYLAVDQILIDQDTLPLSAYLIQIDKYLAQLVPPAYSKVKFSDIERIYDKYLQQADTFQVPADKQNVQVDPQAYQKYQMVKELNLIEVETLAIYHLAQYQANSDLQAYTRAYNQLIETKEAQFQTFYQINAESFELLKEKLADYLNQQALTDSETIGQIAQLHNRYQVKLVLYDEASGQWQMSGESSGYVNDYRGPIQADRVQAQEQVPQPEIPAEDNSAHLSSEIELDSELPERNQLNNHLAAIKDRLGNRRSPSKSKNLPKPSYSIKSLDSSSEVSSDETGPPNKQNSGLPDTGEQRRYLMIAVIPLVIGLGLLGHQLWTKYQRRKAWKEMDLD